MTFADLFESATRNLLRTKGRSGLTMLGIVIGIMSVILVLSIGEAAQRYILAQVSSFGSDMMFIGNGTKDEQGQPSLFIKETLTWKDVKTLGAAPWVTMIAGVVTQSDQLTANGYDTNAQVMGTMPDEIRFNDRTLRQGAFFGKAAVDDHARVAVLGADIANAAFGADDAVGKSVKISSVNFRVIGVMDRAGTQAFQNVDKQVYIPVTAALDLYNKKYLSRISIRTNLPMLTGKQRVQDLLRETHNLDNPNGLLSKDDFNVTTQEDAVQSAKQITDILQILLISIAAISLLVGGIGIMNIMYVSVTERTKEIGLRKAIGARQSEVLGQFLVEAIVLTSIGGVFGLILGIGASWIGITIISTFQDGWTFSISSSGIFLGIGVSAFIGLIFGYFPARRAAQLNPIEALRFE